MRVTRILVPIRDEGANSLSRQRASETLPGGNVAGAPLRPATGFPRGTANAWLLPDPPVTLVDCGPDLTGGHEALKAGFREAGLSLRSLEQIIITHAHPDHGGAAGRLAEATGAQVFVHADDLAALRDPAAARAVRWRGVEAAFAHAGAGAADLQQARARFDAFAGLVTPAPKAKPLPGVLDAGGATLDVLHVPGHTPGSVALHAPREGKLFSGDALLEIITANANALLPKERDALGRHLSSLERLLALPPCVVHPGHGEAFAEHGAVIGRDLGHHGRRSDKVLAILGKGPATTRGVVEKLFLGRVDALFALSEAFGHLALLEKEGLVSADGGLWSLTLAGAGRAAADEDAGEEAGEG